MKNLLLLLFVSTCAWAQDGTLDTSFGDDGILLINTENSDCQDLQNWEYNSLVLSDQNMLLAIKEVCWLPDIERKSFLTLIDAEGAQNSSFGANGFVEVGLDEIIELSELGEHQYVISGTTEYPDDFFQLFKYNFDERDLNFGDNGILQPDYPDLYSQRFLTLEDQSILVWGLAPSVLVLMKYDANGQPVLTFGADGVQTIPLSAESARIQQAQELNNGDIQFLISSKNENTARYNLIRVSSGGNLVTDFGIDGMATSSSIELEIEFVNVQASFGVLSNGQTYIVGEESDGCISLMHHIKFESNGDPANFGVNGVKMFEENAIVRNKMVVQENDRILVSGMWNDCTDSVIFELRRFFSSGHQDYSITSDHTLSFYHNKTFVHPNGYIYTYGATIPLYTPADAVFMARFNNNPLSIGDITSSAISVYPNPSTGIFRIYSTNNDLTGTDYQVADISGKIILEGVLENEIDLSFAESGIYFLKLAGQTHKLLKK